MRTPRILDAEAAAGLVQSGHTVIVEGSSGFGVAEAVLAALERRFEASGEPRDLTLVHTTGVGDRAARGNITLEHECALLEHLSVAQAAHNAGGLVIAQVERMVAHGRLHAQHVKVPGILVDVIVVEPEAWQTWMVRYSPAFSGERRVPLADVPALPMGERKVIARRAAMTLRAGMVINLGVGMAEGVARVAAEEGISDAF